MADSSLASNPHPEPRPYRSHKAPACDLCRTRKIRCHNDIAGQACRFCREKGVTCIVSSTGGSVSSPAPGPRRAKRRRTSTTVDPSSVTRHSEGHHNGLSQYPGVVGTSPTESSLLMNPTMAEDIKVLEKYLTAKPTGASSGARLPYSVISDVPGKPIIYLTYSRRRKGLQLPVDPGNSQREIIDQVLHPHQAEIINLCDRSWTSSRCA